MSNNRELASKLAALSQQSEIEDGAIQMGDLTGAQMLRAVLEAIDNTMLPRQLVISAGDASAALSVGGRRLRSLIAVTGGLDVPEGLLGKQLTRDDKAELKSVAALLEQLATKGRLGVAREAVAQSGGQTDTGVGVTRLVELWGADPYAEPLPIIDGFIAALGDVMLAKKVLLPKGDADAVGAKALLKALDDGWEQGFKAVTEDHAKLYPASVGARCLTKEGLMKGGELVSYVELDDQALLVVTSADSWGKIASVWPLR